MARLDAIISLLKGEDAPEISPLGTQWLVDCVEANLLDADMVSATLQG